MGRFNYRLVLIEKPLGLCSECGEVVYKTEEEQISDEKIAFVCASDLDPEHVYYTPSSITEVQMKTAFNDSHCPKEYDQFCPLQHFPLHDQCYNIRQGLYTKIW